MERPIRSLFRSLDPYLLAGRFRGWLTLRLCRQIQVHGVLIRVCGAGILILGDSGVGKTETALAVVRRGHEWIADDAVMVRRRKNRLVGSGHPRVVSLIHRRGIGIVQAESQLGSGRMARQARIAALVALNPPLRSDGSGDENVPFREQSLLGLKLPVWELTAGMDTHRCLAVIEGVARMLSEGMEER